LTQRERKKDNVEAFNSHRMVSEFITERKKIWADKIEKLKQFQKTNKKQLIVIFNKDH